MASLVHVCLYNCQSVCYRWLRQYVCACTVSQFGIDDFVSTCVCVCACVRACVCAYACACLCTVSLSVVDGFVLDMYVHTHYMFYSYIFF